MILVQRNSRSVCVLTLHSSGSLSQQQQTADGVTWDLVRPHFPHQLLSLITKSLKMMLCKNRDQKQKPHGLETTAIPKDSTKKATLGGAKHKSKNPGGKQ